MNDNKKNSSMNWEIEIGILDNLGIMMEVFKVLLIAAAVPASIVFVFWAIDGFPINIDLQGIKYSIGLILITFGLTGLLILIMGNKYSARYELTQRGVLFKTLPKRRRKNNIIAFLLMLIGASKGNYSAMGAGVLASSRQDMYTDWKKVNKVIYSRKRTVISLKCKDMTKNILFCHENNVEEVYGLVKKYCSKAKFVEK